MSIKKLLCVLLIVGICMSFCGCAFVNTTEELVSPPELTGQLYPISQALSKSAGGNYNLLYPTSGDYRPAIILEDVEGDSSVEAFAF